MQETRRAVTAGGPLGWRKTGRDTSEVTAAGLDDEHEHMG